MPVCALFAELSAVAIIMNKLKKTMHKNFLRDCFISYKMI